MEEEELLSDDDYEEEETEKSTREEVVFGQQKAIDRDYQDQATLTLIIVQLRMRKTT